MRAQTSLEELLAILLGAERALTDALTNQAENLLATETLVLAALDGRAGRTPTDLAALTGLSRGRMTHIADRLIERGYAERSVDPDDRRRVLLTLTAEGRPLAARAAQRVRTLQAGAIERLGAAGLDMLSEQLRGLKIVCEE